MTTPQDGFADVVFVHGVPGASQQAYTPDIGAWHPSAPDSDPHDTPLTDGDIDDGPVPANIVRGHVPGPFTRQKM